MNTLPIQPFQETLGECLCAPATLKMLLMYWDLPGQNKSDLQLAEICGTDPELGTTNEMFLDTASNFGLEAEVKTEAEFEDIKVWLEKQIPVVVDWFSPGRQDAPPEEMPDGHYSIVVGLNDKYICLQDPETGGMRKVPRKQFYRVWFDFEKDWIMDSDEMVIRWMAAMYPQQDISK